MPKRVKRYEGRCNALHCLPAMMSSQWVTANNAQFHIKKSCNHGWCSLRRDLSTFRLAGKNLVTVRFSHFFNFALSFPFVGESRRAAASTFIYVYGSGRLSSEIRSALRSRRRSPTWQRKKSKVPKAWEIFLHANQPFVCLRARFCFLLSTPEKSTTPRKVRFLFECWNLFLAVEVAKLI